MKVEVINSSTQNPIKTYSVSHLSMFDFHEWNVLNEVVNEVVIDLDDLSDAAANLDSKDSTTNELISNSRRVEFYLPDPIKNRMLSQLAESQKGTDESSDQSLDEVTEKVSMPALKSITILSAVVTEILQNHRPHSDYKVRISDG